jgi:hypothetical protein
MRFHLAKWSATHSCRIRARGRPDRWLAAAVVMTTIRWEVWIQEGEEDTSLERLKIQFNT